MRRNQPQLYLNLAQVYLSEDKRAEAHETLVEGLRYTARDSRLLRALQRLGMRRRPAFPFLSRSHFLNRCVGHIRHLTGKLLHAM